MRVWLHSVAEAVRSVHRERRRLAPMALGIVWGVASVMLLLAVAGGFERSQKGALEAYGDKFLLVRLNRAELDRAAGTEERRLQMRVDDVERLRNGAPAIVRLSPMNMAYWARVTGRSGAGTNAILAGVLSEIARIRNLPLEEGRFLNEIDEEERNRVVVLGPLLKKQLFGPGPAVGEKVRVSGFSRSMIPSRNAPAAASPGVRRDLVRARDTDPGAAARSAALRRSRDRRANIGASQTAIGGELFTVVGVLKDVEVQPEAYVSVERMGFIPFSTSCAVFDRDFSTMLIEPRSTADRDVALRQFKEVLGARYGFSPEDRNAVVIYFDAIRRAESISAIFGAIRVFLAAVGSLLLGIGAIGVMNVVLVSVAARRFEIGLRKALGAAPALISAQFFAETLLACLSSGALGFLLGLGGIAVLQAVPLPEGFSRPAFDAQVGAFALGLLLAVASAAGFYPARRAASLPPAEALRGR